MKKDRKNAMPLLVLMIVLAVSAGQDASFKKTAASRRLP